MIKKSLHTLFILFLATSALVLAGCNAQGTATPTTDPVAVYTQVAQTVQAQITSNAKLTQPANNTPKPTETQGPTATLRPTSTPLSQPTVAATSLTPQKSGTPAATSLTPQKSATAGTLVPTKPVATTAVAATQSGVPASPDKMMYISQTIPDASTFSPLQTFTITWVIQNIGTTTWDDTYLVRLFAGPSLGASNGSLGQTVKPQGQAKITMEMRAPDTMGDYNVIWVITAPDGHNFGSFTLNFKVK